MSAAQATSLSDSHNIDAAVAATPEDLTWHGWSPMLRLGFRLAFCYFVTYALCVGNATIWGAIPVAGDYLSRWFASPFRLFGQYLAVHLFHVQGAGAFLHGGGSGDTAIDWIVVGEMFTLALVASLLWTALDRHRAHYQTLAAWLRFLIRLTLGMGMLTYGFAKLFPLQMQPPILPVLNEPLGNTSPMTMLWTLIGLNPVYEMVCGGAELTGGALILLRRTALAGALLTAFVMANVVLYNFFFDVPVKLYASHLLLMALFVVLPDVKPLISFFWKHEPAAPRGIWVPPASRPGFRRATAIIEVAFVLLSVGLMLYSLVPRWQALTLARNSHSPLRGGWRLDSSTVQGKPQALLVGIDRPVEAFYVENPLYGYMRSTDGALWRTRLKTDDSKHTLDVNATGSEGASYKFVMPDNNHLVLSPIGKSTVKTPALSFTRLQLAANYPLLNRGFHLVNEWGLER